MRITILRSLGLVAAVVGFAGHARAQTASTASTALQKAGAVLTDGTEAGVSGEDDAIGTAGAAPMFIGSDSTYLYFRMRVSDTPIGGGPNWRSGYACFLDTDDNLDTYEFYAGIVGGSSKTVSWRYNSARSNSTSDAPDVTIGSTYDVSTNADITATGTGTQQLITWWIPWAQIATTSGGSPAVGKGTSFRFACGTTTGADIAQDPVGVGAGVTTLNTIWSSPYVCGNTGCALDTDGDGISDADENNVTKTNPLQVDTDGDGFPDNVEASASGSAGPFVFIDTDNDGTADGADADADNDCISDQNERINGSDHRSAASPQPTTSLNCSTVNAALPICVAGTCTACGANFGGGGATACFSSSSPACQLSGGLAGRCTQCKVGLTTQCTTAAAPACEETTGACAACNGDNGEAGKTSVCPDAAAPACQKVGAPAGILGRCTVCSPTNTALCTTPTAPACDPAAGTCAPCDGDKNGGTTKGCPSTSNPYCFLAGGSQGTCGKCTSNADCGDGHAGPTCDLPTGACVDKDSDGDGLNDSVEKILGTDFLKIDTDGDGTIDALDTDSDDDGILDAVEGKTDVDSDGTPNFRDADDDGDGLSTKSEIAAATAANVSDDVDGDGKKNYYDSDTDGDGKGDAFEGTGDDDGDGIPNFLDPDDKTAKPFDAGTPIAPTPQPTANPGAPAPGAPTPAEDGAVLEGSGFACSAASGRSSGLVLVALAGLVVGAVRRRRKR